MVKLKKLLSDCVLVHLEPEKKQTDGGLVIPDTREEPIRVGRVLMVGPGRQFTDKYVPMDPDLIGRRVAFYIATAQTRQGQQLTQYLEEDHLLIRQGDILVVLDEDVEVSF